jgi:fatty acid desaturase
MIAELDPELEDAESSHLAMEVLTPPFMAHLGYASGAARTVASPRIAERATRQGAGDQLVRPRARNVDTLTFFSELFRFGHRSREGIAACARIQEIHRAVGRIRNDDQVFVLSQLILGHERVGRALGRCPYSEREGDALLHFWLGVGRAMRLRDLPETRAELRAWVDDYERRYFEPTEMGHQAAEGYLRGFEESVGRSRRSMARSLFVTMMDEPMRECLGYEPTPAPVAAVWRAQWRTFVATTPIRPMRLDSTWVEAFSRTGPNPDLTRIGYGTYDGHPPSGQEPPTTQAEPVQVQSSVARLASPPGPMAEIRIAEAWRGAPRGRFLTNPTVLLFLAAEIGGAANLAGYVAGRLPFAVAAIVQLVVLYVLWYVMHEASHRSAHRSRRVNDVIGWLSAAPLLLAFACFVERHRQHHANTNDPRADPDIAVSRTSWPRWFLGLYFPATYGAECARGGKRRSASLRLQQRAHDAAILAALGTSLLLGGPGLVALWILPLVLIAPIITFTFGYLPHRPFSPRGRYRDTREQHGRLLTLLLFGQNHHLTHHLWVDVPWFRLRGLAGEVETRLRERECTMTWK